MKLLIVISIFILSIVFIVIIKIILNKIGIYKIIHQPFRKNSKSHNNYKSYYNNDILDKVNLIMKEDFEHFDYTKIDNINDF